MRSLVLAISLVAGVAQSSAQQFAGKWVAALDGKTYVRLELTDTNGRLTGRVSLGAVHFAPSGDITEVLKPATDFTPIFDVALRGGALTFWRKDGDDVDRFELRVVNGDAQLTFVLGDEIRAELAAQGVANVKPTKLTKAR
jgi:hypothetical protein